MSRVKKLYRIGNKIYKPKKKKKKKQQQKKKKRMDGVYAKNINRKVEGVPQAQPQPTPDTKRKRKMKKWKKKKKKIDTYKTNKQMYEKHKTSSLLPKRGDHNAKRNDEIRGQRARKDFKTWNAP